MFRFMDGNGKEYKVFFRYDKRSVPANTKKANSIAHVKPCATSCFIKDADDKIVDCAKAICRSDEQFEYRFGRRLSLKRALENAGFDVATRTNAWKSMPKLY